MKQILLALFFTLCFLITPAYADVLYLKDGSVLKGKINKLDSQSVEIKTSVGVFTIARDQIKKSEMGEAVIAPADAEEKKLSPPPIKAQVESFALATGKSVYSERTLGLGFAAGTSSGSGLSAILYRSPASFNFTAFPINDGYSVGAQIQMDLIQFKYQRFHGYLGGAIYSRFNDPFYNLGLGFGYGWMAAKFIGFTLNGGMLGTIDSDDNTTEITWGPDINFLLHFSVL